MTLEQALKRLHEAPFAEHVHVRDELVRELRKEGQPHLARRLAGERKPKRTTWAMDRVDPKLLERLERARAEARKAQESKWGDDLREALMHYREAISDVVDAAKEILRDSGLSPTSAHERSLRGMLEHGLEDLPAKAARRKKIKSPPKGKEDKRKSAKEMRIRQEIDRRAKEAMRAADALAKARAKLEALH